jgi:hypothetical protein
MSLAKAILRAPTVIDVRTSLEATFADVTSPNWPRTLRRDGVS